MMKLLLYFFLFLAILGFIGFGFFTMTTPDIQQTTIQKNIDPKDAFGSKSLPLIQSDPSVSAPSSATPYLTEE